MEACRAHGVVAGGVERIVVASSDKAYGDHEQLPYREDLPLQPRYPYDVSKACTDLIARSYAATFELPVAVTRLANVYGPGDLNWSRIVPDSARALAKGDRPVIRSDGSPSATTCSSRTRWLRTWPSRPRSTGRRARGRAWNAGSGQPVSVLEVTRRLIAAAGLDVEPDVQGKGTPHGEIDRQFLDSSAVREELGWAPQWELDRGLGAAWEWYRARLG